MTSNVDERERVLTLYRTMRTKELRHLSGVLSTSKAFCEQRLAWIDEVLREREAEPEVSLEAFLQRGMAAQQAVDAAIADHQPRTAGPLTIEGHWLTRVVRVNGVVLDPAASQKIWNHSPDGFNWGYAGSGPAQLALAILLHAGVPEQRAVRLHQAFKRACIAPLARASFRIEIDVAQWVAAQETGDHERCPWRSDDSFGP